MKMRQSLELNGISSFIALGSESLLVYMPGELNRRIHHLPDFSLTNGKGRPSLRNGITDLRFLEPQSLTIKSYDPSILTGSRCTQFGDTTTVTREDETSAEFQKSYAHGTTG